MKNSVRTRLVIILQVVIMLYDIKSISRHPLSCFLWQRCLTIMTIQVNDTIIFSPAPLSLEQCGNFILNNTSSKYVIVVFSILRSSKRIKRQSSTPLPCVRIYAGYVLGDNSMLALLLCITFNR